MSKGILTVLTKYNKAIRENKSEDIISSYEEIISECIQEMYVHDQLYQIPFHSFLSIIKRINFDSIDDSFIILHNIIQQTTKHYPNESCLLLNKINCKDCVFSFNDCINLIRCFDTSDLCSKLKEFDIDEKLPERDYEYDLQAKQNEINSLKQTIKHLNHKISKLDKKFHFKKVTSKPDDFEPDLHQAAKLGKLSSVQYHIEICGKDKDEKDQFNCTPLHTACEFGQFMVAVYLIEKQNADIEAIESRIWTPLHYAAKGGFLDLVEYLCNKGANKEAQSYSGATPLLRACLHNSLNVVKYLIETQHVYDGSNHKIGSFPVHYGCTKGHLAIVKYFIEHRKVSIELREIKTGFTPLHVASSNGFIIIVRYLVSNNADINAKSKTGKTPIMLAAQHGKTDIVEYLLSKGADKSISNQDGDTALSLASNDEIKALLQ